MCDSWSVVGWCKFQLFCEQCDARDVCSECTRCSCEIIWHGIVTWHFPLQTSSSLSAAYESGSQRRKAKWENQKWRTVEDGNVIDSIDTEIQRNTTKYGMQRSCEQRVKIARGKPKAKNLYSRCPSGCLHCLVRSMITSCIIMLRQVRVKLFICVCRWSQATLTMPAVSWFHSTLGLIWGSATAQASQMQKLQNHKAWQDISDRQIIQFINRLYRVSMSFYEFLSAYHLLVPFHWERIEGKVSSNRRARRDTKSMQNVVGIVNASKVSSLENNFGVWGVWYKVPAPTTPPALLPQPLQPPGRSFKARKTSTNLPQSLPCLVFRLLFLWRGLIPTASYCYLDRLNCLLSWGIAVGFLKWAWLLQATQTTSTSSTVTATNTSTTRSVSWSLCVYVCVPCEFSSPVRRHFHCAVKEQTLTDMYFIYLYFDLLEDSKVFTPIPNMVLDLGVQSQIQAKYKDCKESRANRFWVKQRGK